MGSSSLNAFIIVSGLFAVIACLTVLVICLKMKKNENDEATIVRPNEEVILVCCIVL